MSGTPHKTVTAPVTAILPSKVPDPAKVGDKNIAPTTTAEEDTGTAGQRHINRVWEYTQAILAITVACATLYVAARLALNEKPNEGAFLLLSNAFFVIVSTYLARTNHTKSGGVEKGDVGR
jgi:hypothetical protein